MFKTAVLVQTHCNEKYIYNLARKNKNVLFYVHVDKKNCTAKEWFLKNELSNLYVINDNVNVHWGGGSQFIATLKLMKEAYKTESVQYFHLMSGECYPVTSFVAIEKQWDLVPNVNFIESNKNTTFNWRFKTPQICLNTPYLRVTIVRVINKLLRLLFSGEREPKTYNYHGSQWFSLNRKMVGFLLEKEKDGAFFEYYKVPCSDEHAIQTLARHSGEKIANSNKRYIVFPHGSSSPKYLTSSEIENIMLTNTKYWFVRKVKYEDLMVMLNKDMLS